MKYQTPTLLALNQNTGVACNWTSAAKDCNLLRQYKDTRPVLSENPSNGLAESKSAKSLLRRSTEKLISKANLRHRPRPIGKHSSIPSFTANPGFAQFLREHSSPKHHRVTAGGRIVPMQPVDRTMSAEGQETPDGQRGFQNINMQQTPQGYMNAPPSQQGWQPLAPLAHQIQPPQYQGNTFNPPNPHPSFNLYYSVGTPAHNPETGTQSNGNSFPMDPANQAGLVFWNNAQTSLIATPDALAHFAATVMNEIESSMVNIEQMRSLQFNLIQHRLNVQEALDQANIAIAWTQVTQPIQRDLRITYINMRNILDEAIGILESRMQLIHTSTIPVHYGVGQPTGTNMSPPPEYSFVNQAASGQTNMNWEVSSNSGISVSHIELADVDPQINWEVSSNSGISVSHIEFADVNPQMNWEVSSNSGVSVEHIESADMEPQADTANEMQFNSQYDDDTAFMGSSRLEWSPKRNLRADDSDCDNESDLEDLQHNQLDGTCSEEGMRRASDDELSPCRSSGLRVNKAQIEGPSQFSWFSWPGNFLETDYDALLGGSHGIEPELAETKQNWGKNSMRERPFEGLLDSDQDEDRDDNETESECCGEDLAQNAPPLSRRGSKSGEADIDINDSLTSDEWTIFLSPPRYSHRLRSSPPVSSEVKKIDPIMSDNHNENSAANPEGGQADLPETATEAIVVRLPDPLHPGNGVIQAQPTNLMAANHVGEMEEGNNNNNDRRRSQAGHATVQLSTAGALGELTQVARDNGARPTPAAEVLQQALANEATPSARRRLGRRMAQRREGHEEGLDDSNQEGTVARPSTPADPISPGQQAYLERVARETLVEMARRDEMARRAAMANGPNVVVNYDEEMNDE